MNTPKIIADKYLDVAESKMNTPWYKTLMLAVMAGMFIAVGSVAATIASRSFEGATANIVKGAIFPVGLAMVIVAGSELFTGNCLLIMPLLQKRISFGRNGKKSCNSIRRKLHRRNSNCPYGYLQSCIPDHRPCPANSKHSRAKSLSRFRSGVATGHNV